MGVRTPVIPRRRLFTVADLEGVPDDGNRYELIDGMLHVSPAPPAGHQLVLGELVVVLRLACPAGLRVLLAPVDVQLDTATSLRPDALEGDAEFTAPRPFPVTVIPARSLDGLRPA